MWEGSFHPCRQARVNDEVGDSREKKVKRDSCYFLTCQFIFPTVCVTWIIKLSINTHIVNIQREGDAAS